MALLARCRIHSILVVLASYMWYVDGDDKVCLLLDQAYQCQ